MCHLCRGQQRLGIFLNGKDTTISLWQVLTLHLAEDAIILPSMEVTRYGIILLQKRADYEETWGFEDEKLYQYAKEKLLELAAQGEPFNFSMLTVDTHTGGGYKCRLCPDTYETQYQNVWACASNQLDDFIEWIQQQDFYENTTICITGDHSSMEEGFLVEYDYEKQKVYNDGLFSDCFSRIGRGN